MKHVRLHKIGLVLSLTVLCLAAGNVYAGRLFGNVTLSYEHIEREGDGEAKDDLTRETAIINYEDVLFYKNHIRLTANLQRREQSVLNYHEFQPIYYFDLKSYGYAANVRYSPYKRRSMTTGGIEIIDVYYRDWRVTSQLNYDGWPTLSMVYSRLSNFDKGEERRFDSYNRNWVFESSYSIDPLILRANYNNLKQVNNLSGGNEISTETYSGTAGFSRSVPGLGYLSTTYNYYDTRRQSTSVNKQTSNTHSISSIAILSPIEMFSVNASYSGRFTNADQLTMQTENDNQNISAQAEFSPTAYLSFQAGKGYQELRANGSESTTEYINLGISASRYFRSGVDTRLNYNRTIFQQSPRMITIFDTAGAVVATVNDGDYILDSYQASINLSPRKYIRTYLDFSLLHDNEPVDEQRRYQITRSLDVRVNFTRRLEGRFRVTAQYLGEKLRLDRSFSENYNVGLTYIPQGNININATYIYSNFNTSIKSSLSSLTGYFSYSFRRAFTFYVSVNDQIQKRELPIVGADDLIETESRPRNVNGQLLIYVSPRATLSVGYLRSRSQGANGLKIINQSVQSVLSIQI